MKTVLHLVANDLRRDWRRPWTIVLYAALPLGMAMLIGAVFGGRGGGGAMPTVHVAVLDQDQDMLSGALRSMAGQGAAAERLRLHFVATRAEGIEWLEARRASAFVVLPPRMTEGLLAGRTNAVELHENPAEQVLPKVVRQGASLLTAGLSGAAEVLGEPLREMRELFGQGTFPAESAVTGAASRSWDKLRNVRGYLFPPLVQFETVEAGSYSPAPTNAVPASTPPGS